MRLVSDGRLRRKGAPCWKKARLGHERLDKLRKAIILEPRGHTTCRCAVDRAGAARCQRRLLFMHKRGLEHECGHGIIAVTTIAMELADLCLPRRSPMAWRIEPV